METRSDLHTHGAQSPAATVSLGRETAILAGNSRVAITASGVIVVEPQLAAFRAGIERAGQLSGIGGPPLVSVAFDHRGIFRKQFLGGHLTNSQKRHPRLSQLRTEISSLFESAARDVGFSLESIVALHEDSARTHASHLVRHGNCPSELMHWIRFDPKSDSADDDDDDDDDDQAIVAPPTSCAIGNRDVDRVTCAAVTAEYFVQSLAPTTRVLEVYIEDDPWSKASVYTRGALLMEALGHSIDVRILLVDKRGLVLGKRQ